MKAIFTLLLVGITYVAQAFPGFYGYSEFFIRINEPGVYTVRIDDQVITNASGKFRFFDLRPGVKEVYVQRNGMNFMRSTVSIYNNSRTVAEFRGLKGLVILQQVPLMQNNQTQPDFWYGYWNYNGNVQYPNPNNPYEPSTPWNPNVPNNPNYPNTPNYPNNPNGNWNNPPMGMDANTFGQFKETVRKQSFDSNKVSLIKNSAKTANFTSAQVAELLGLMSFDSYKLDAAKYCYDYTINKNNYFKTFDQFQFDSYVKDLSDYIANRN